MIIYSCFSNIGGMKRVSEGLVRQRLGDDVFYVIFAPDKPENLPENSHWIQWKNKPGNYNPDVVRNVRTQIDQQVQNRKISFIVGDCLTLIYFEHLNRPLVYDVHNLSLPLTNAIQDNPGLFEIDFYTKLPVNKGLTLEQLKFSRFEFTYIQKSSAFLCNSKNTERYLKQYYPGAVFGKSIYHIPLVSDEPISIQDEKEKKIPFYAFGRWHPQKGYHHLLSQNWDIHNLTIRGIEGNLFSEEGVMSLKNKGILLREWTEDRNLLLSELSQSEIILFPSIYEPYGLALTEALRSGCLCVAHKNNSGHEEQINNGENGFLLDMGSSEFQRELYKILALPEGEKQRIRENAKNAKFVTLSEREKALRSAFLNILSEVVL